MRADEVLVAHHEVLRGLVRALAETGPDRTADRERLRGEFLREIEVHAQIEDEIFYPAVRDVSPQLAVAHAEHRQIDDQLATVMRTPVGHPDFLAEVRMLEETLHHHMFEEEQRMFPESHALGEDRLQELGRRLAERQEELYRSRVMRFVIGLKHTVLRLV